jgi:homoserine O-succinyltransferase
MFLREGRSRVVFLQGHPEFGAETLGRDYLSDVANFLMGDGVRPAIPENYFDRVTENALQALAARNGQIGEYKEVILGAVPLQSWHNYTLRLFANWIATVATEKSRRRASRPVSLRRSA